MNSQNINSEIKKRSFQKYILISALLIFSFVWYNRLAVYDWIRLLNYVPAPSIQSIVVHDTLTQRAKHLFYINRPLLQNKTTFAKACPQGDKETAVLGCYIPNQRGIYVLTVTDSRLNGIQEVTAAHEMLHAAYDRLSSKEKQQLNGWLQNYYSSLTDANIKAQIDSYKKTEPNDILNEMHSIFGTEVTVLSPELEKYYSRYFDDRSKVTSFYTTYESEFTTRQNQIKQYDAQLKQIKLQIEDDESDLKSKQAQLSAQQQNLDSQRSRGNIAAYNSGVPAFNALVDSYNAEVGEVRSLIEQYNNMVTARNALVLEEQQLVEDISSNVTTIKSQ